MEGREPPSPLQLVDQDTTSSPVLMLASGTRYLHIDSSGRFVGPCPVVRSRIPLRRRDSPRGASTLRSGATNSDAPDPGP